MARYHQNGRFLSPDPYQASGGSGVPQSWNRYAYVMNDPVNLYDPPGLFISTANPPPSPDPPPTSMPSIGGSGLGGGDDTLTPENSAGKEISVGAGIAGSARISITNFTTSSLTAVGVQNSLRWLKQALLADQTCSDWLVNNQLVIDQLLGDAPGTTTIVGVGNFSDPAVNAVAGVGGTNLAPGTAGITVNLTGAYFNSALSAGYGTNIQGGSDAAKALILVHELAHVTGANGFLDNDNNPSAQTQNNHMLLERCGKTIHRAAGLP
jgi:hypothetical protein